MFTVLFLFPLFGIILLLLGEVGGMVFLLWSMILWYLVLYAPKEPTPEVKTETDQEVLNRKQREYMKTNHW